MDGSSIGTDGSSVLENVCKTILNRLKNRFNASVYRLNRYLMDKNAFEPFNRYP